MSNIDLRTCVPGQLVELRNGNIVRYGYRSKDSNTYPHRVKDSFYTDDGHYFLSGEEDDDDVVRILQLDKPEQTKTNTHPSVAWWESCPWITDRKPTKEDSDHLGQVIQQVSSKFDAETTLDLCFISWAYVKEGQAWIHSLNWKPLKQTPREKALALITKHKDSSTVGVWVPTPDEWDIIREGLTE